MWLVPRHRPGTHIVPSRRVSRGQRQALHRHCHCRETALDPNTTRQVDQVIRLAHGKRLWLACDCHRGPLSKQALLAPRLSAKATTLVRLQGPGRPEHTPRCPLHRVGSEPKPTAPCQELAWLRTVALAPEISRSEGLASPAGKTQHSLARVLFTVIERAGLNRIDFNTLVPSYKDQYARLHRVAAEIPIIASEGISLSQYLCTYIPALPKLYRRLRQAPTHWGKRFQRHGFLVTVVDDISPQHLIIENAKPVRVKGPLVVNSPARSTARPPYWAIAVVGEERPDHFELLSAYVHPVYSKQLLIPVDSEVERQTLRLLMRALGGIQAKALTLHKPVFDIRLSDQKGGGHCRPDFILRASDVSIVIETMGMTGQDYGARKARTHQRMGRIGPVVTHAPGQDERFVQGLGRQLRLLGLDGYNTSTSRT